MLVLAAARMPCLPILRSFTKVLGVVIGALVITAPVAAQPTPEEVFAAVVHVEAKIPVGARTAPSLGTERRGSGVVIDDDGLILTIGYLILEASEVTVTDSQGTTLPAEIIAYDYATGFGLLRTTQSLDIAPLTFGVSGDAEEGDPVLVISYGGREAVQVSQVVSRRDFAGYWEYLLENAILTSPPYPQFAGAALIGPAGKLIGIGSLFVRNSLGNDSSTAGNMFVPIDALKPILSDLITDGRTSVPRRPWLGVYLEQLHGHILVSRLAKEGPAEGAGIEVGDIMLKVAGQSLDDLADFYRKIWTLGNTGVEVPLEVLRKSKVIQITVPSGNRYDWLRLNPSKDSTQIKAQISPSRTAKTPIAG
ncbi:MAG: S1C family serine protease [Gammaproteobacteria bacterium]|nr:S1C family serine protease [Gammaproteobacteria bacterium]